MAVAVALAAAVVLATMVMGAITDVLHRRFARLWARGAGAMLAVGGVAYGAGLAQGTGACSRRWLPLGAEACDGGELVEAWVNPVVGGCLVAGVALGIVAVRRRGGQSEMSASEAP
ncbi:hypothetical protein [Phytomonospora endophytica]|uniref:Uncharacterized protein n=1 Tax=Phytomonospora endophytica TaxID=714109 RepID=A0A841FV83_9ACTN|nr:hypothetical protein [Phytomonospora endophytica]MBB6039916.1 hypothetical protein [Phytomonospora endophytica]GIG71014.1 hypothetical protein Pen01_73090 [Phytomonospora endophytica]